MAIVNNISTESGDILRIQTEVPIIGLVSLTSFVDDTEGEGVDKSFEKKFRYSLNGGLTFTEWFDLTTINLQSIEVTQYDNFVIDYQYIHTGTDGDLTYNSTTISGEFDQLPYPVYDDSFFSKYFDINDPNVLGWAINVLEKIYKKGLLASYVERGESNTGNADEDFVVFWNTFTHIFAIIVYFARQFEDITANTDILRKFILSKGLYISPSTGYTDLLYLYQNYITEFAKRGTVKIVESLADGNNIDGELLRLINKGELDEFIFCLCNQNEIGWNIGNSSPMFTGTQFMDNAIKGYEFTEDVVDLGNYPIINNSELVLEDGWIKITTPTSETGVGNDTDFRIIVDPSIDYEVAFIVKIDTLSDDLNFGVTATDKNGVDTDIYSKVDGTTVTNYFFEDQGLKIADQEYWIRGVLFNKDASANADDKLNIDIAHNLILNEDTVYIIPKITVNSGYTGNVYIKDIKVRPRVTEFSQGFLGAKNVIINWFKNNSPDYSNSKLIELVKRYLLPYNSIYKEIIL